MSFGLCNTPSIFQQAMNLVLSRLRGLTWKTVLAFLGDVLVLGKDFQDHLNNLQEVLDWFIEYNLKLKPKKVRVVPDKGTVLGENSKWQRGRSRPGKYFHSQGLA